MVLVRHRCGCDGCCCPHRSSCDDAVGPLEQLSGHRARSDVGERPADLGSQESIEVGGALVRRLIIFLILASCSAPTPSDFGVTVRIDPRRLAPAALGKIMNVSL